MPENSAKTQSRGIAQSYVREATKIEKQISIFLDHIGKAESASVMAAYEKRITQLEHAKLVLIEKQENAGKNHGTFEELFEIAFGFISSP